MPIPTTADICICIYAPHVPRFYIRTCLSNIAVATAAAAAAEVAAASTVAGTRHGFFAGLSSSAPPSSGTRVATFAVGSGWFSCPRSTVVAPAVSRDLLALGERDAVRAAIDRGWWGLTRTSRFAGVGDRGAGDAAFTLSSPRTRRFAGDASIVSVVEDRVVSCRVGRR